MFTTWFPDFHTLEHFNTWKTLLPCAPNEDAVVSFLRSDARAYLVAFPLVARPVERVAA